MEVYIHSSYVSLAYEIGHLKEVTDKNDKMDWNQAYCSVADRRG